MIDQWSHHPCRIEVFGGKTGVVVNYFNCGNITIVIIVIITTSVTIVIMENTSMINLLTLQEVDMSVMVTLG